MKKRNKKVSVGIVGVGHLGKYHVKHLTAIDNVECGGLYDIDEANQKLVRRFTGRVTKKLDVETFMDYPIPDFIIK